MARRLDTDKQAKLEPMRIAFAKKELEAAGVTDIFQTPKSLKFTHKTATVTLYPYSGWFSGKGIQDGRGIKELITQLKKL